MKITLLELQKIIRSPIIIILTLIFVGFNVFTIISNSYLKDELKVLNQIVEKYGITFNDERLKELEGDIRKGVRSVDEQFDSVEVFFNQLTYEKYEAYDVTVQEVIDELSLLYMYYNLASALEERYAELDIKAIGEEINQTSGITGVAKNITNYEYEKLAGRFNEMVEQEEYKTWFFAGNPYRMHSQLFRELVSMVAIEGTLLVVLISAFIACYEKDNRTSLVTYSTKVGRRLMMKKWQASLLGTLLISGFLIIPTLVTFFATFDYSGLWESRISSGLNWEYNLPYVTWWDLSFIQYLGLAIVIILATWLLISTLTFGLSVLIHNSYIATISVYLLLIAMNVIPSMFTFSPLLLLLGHFNPTLLLLNPHMYFNGLAGLTGHQYHELITLLLWLGISVFCLILSYKRFMRKDLV